jgi:hypothetical protein
MKYKMTEAALHRIGKMWVTIMKKKIKQSKKIASGFLYNSIAYSVIEDGKGGFQLEIQYADYWKYVNDGREAKGEERPISAENGAVPIPALKKWIGIKKIKGRDKEGKFISNTSLAFAIRASIWRYGIKPANFFDRSITSLESMLDPTKIPPSTPPELKAELEKIFIDAADDINIIVENMITKELSK